MDVRLTRRFACLLAIASLLAISCTDPSNQSRAAPGKKDPVPVPGNCLPTIAVRPEWLVCATDSDCVVAGDACRSCGPLVSVNREHVAAFDTLDQELRVKANCVRACEACSTRDVKPTCIDRRCVAPPRQ